MNLVRIFTAIAALVGCCALALQAGLSIHPARFPHGVPDFFIRFLTEPGQLVVDPFAGSNMTGYMAEQLERSWLSVEISSDYVAGSRLRFGEVSAGQGRCAITCRPRVPLELAEKPRLGQPFS